MTHIANEMSVLGSMYIDPSCIDSKVKSKLTENDFFGVGHKEIFNGIISCNDQYEKVDLILLRNELERLGILSECGGVEYLVKVGEETPHSATVDHYVELVKRYSKRQTVLFDLKNSLTNITDSTIEPETVAMDVMTQMEELIASSSSGSDISIDGIERRGYDLCEGKFVQAIRTGIDIFDTHFDGFTVSGMTVIAARPRVGKTALALQIAMDLAERGVKVGMFSAEMPKDQLYDRMIQYHSGLSVKHIKEQHRVFQGNISSIQKGEIEAAIEHIKTNIAPNIWVDDTGSISIDQIEMRMCRPEYDCDVLFIDHLQELSIPFKQGRAIDVGNAVGRIKQTGRDRRHIVLLCQLNRGVENRTNNEPNLGDLKESGKIEEAANNIVFLHRQECFAKGEIGEQVDDRAKLIIAKARDGESGHGFVEWVPHLTKFINQ